MTSAYADVVSGLARAYSPDADAEAARGQKAYMKDRFAFFGLRSPEDADFLFAACRRHASSTEFFHRTAIGWAWREYSKTDADAVRRFAGRNESALSGRSKREGLKWLSRQ